MWTTKNFEKDKKITPNSYNFFFNLIEMFFQKLTDINL